MKRSRNPRYLKQYRDRAGNCINQYRRGGRLIRLPNGRDFTDAWWKAYYEAEASILRGQVRRIAETRTRPNSIDAALVAYYRSTTFLSLAENTRRTFRTSLERDFRPIVGSAPLSHLRTKHIIDLIAEKAEEAPAGAKVTLTALRSFCGYAVSVELLKSNPTIGVKAPKLRSEQHHAWTEDEIAQYRDRWPDRQTLSRRAMELHLLTGQRAGDVILMGWQHIGRDGLIRITQEKTGEAVAIPIGPDLQRVLDALSRTNLTFVVSKTGRPFKSVNYYDRYFREWCDAAGLPKRCTSHGLRYAMVRRLVEAGKTPWEIAAITGHCDLRMIQHYARQHDKERLAHQAIAAVTALETRTGVSSVAIPLDKTYQ